MNNSMLFTEEQVFDLLHPGMLEVVRYNNANPDKLILRRGESYSSVWIGTQMAFRICCRKNKYYFGVASRLFDLAPEEARAAAKYKSNAEYQEIPFVPTKEGVQDIAEFLGQLLDAAIDAITKEYDCCSRVEECSNAGRCVNPSTDIAMLCGYRKIMKSGRIFYGKNRNID